MNVRWVFASLWLLSLTVWAGEPPGYRVLPGISHGRITIFPILAGAAHDTSSFLTLDEGLRSGKVIVTEAGRLQGLRRGRARHSAMQADVNRLLLVNDSDRPLLLLAGEIVVGGKQDRVVAKDRIVPPHSDPVDLSVFCVEPGRWSDTMAGFSGLTGQMAQPKVRSEAMRAKNQQKVWDAVNASNETATLVVGGGVGVGAGGGGGSGAGGGTLRSTTSYAQVADNQAVKSKMAEISDPIDRAYQKVIHDLANKNAVGVVVAVNGRMVWADIFASPQLLQAYWPKLIRSYAAEVLGLGKQAVSADQKEAQAFVERLQGRHETVETEAGLFRHAEIKGDGYYVFTLTSLVPRTGFDLHIAKMSEDAEKPIPLRR